jgi:hypothetical protein
VCSTCEDPKSTNPDLCGAAKAARREEAHRVVQARDRGDLISEIAERHNCSKARIIKLFNEGMEVANRDKRVELEFMLQKLDDAIDEARRDVDALEGPERVTAREAQWKLEDRKAKLLDLYPEKRVTVKTGPVETPKPSDDVMALYRKFQEGQ